MPVIGIDRHKITAKFEALLVNLQAGTDPATSEVDDILDFLENFLGQRSSEIWRDPDQALWKSLLERVRTIRSFIGSGDIQWAIGATEEILQELWPPAPPKGE